MEILEPIGEVEQSAHYRLAQRTRNLNGKILGLLSNHQPNADLLMAKLKPLLARRFSFADIIIGEEAEVTGKCNLLVTGIGF